MPSEKITLTPEDRYNQELVDNTHPHSWENPSPSGRYNLVVIGAGTAGLVSAAGAAALGGKVALIERHLMGGDCLNVGCVPSKGLIRAARAFADVRDAGDFGVVVPDGVKVDFRAVMERMRRLRAQISPNDSARRFRDMGIDVYFGDGRFRGKDEIEVDGRVLRFSRAAIATGARASVPPIPGVAEAGYLTNETIFNLTELPKRFGIIGAGPIGSEMAQSFARFGSEVYLFERSDQVLPRETGKAASLIEKVMEKDGVNLMKECLVLKVEKKGKEKLVHVKHRDKEQSVAVDEILVSIGRAPNVETLNLESAGVKFDTRSGIEVNEYLQSSNPRIYAAGDVCFPYKFTHTAEAQAAILVQNSLFFRTRKTAALTIPWCTYTDPEVAHVGLSLKAAAEKEIAVDTYTTSFADVDRAILDGEDGGFIEVHTKIGSDEILGCTIVARHAGEMISEVTVAMVGKLGLSSLASTIHPYPTQAESIRKVGREYYRTKLTPFVKKLMTRWMAWRR